MRFRSVFWWWALSLMVLVAGCGNSRPSVFTGGPGELGSVVLPLSGQFFLGVPVAEAQIRLLASDGSEVAVTQTDASGNFFFERPRGLDRFRVAASLAGSGLTFTKDVENLGEQAPFLAINVPTTLAGQLLQSGQAASVADAEGQVASALGLGSLNVLEDSPRSPFSHLGFFLTIAQDSGFGEFSVAAISAQGQALPPYRMTLSTLRLPWGALEAELKALLEPSRQVQLVAESQAEAASSGNFLTGIFQGLGSKVVSNAEDTTLTWTGHLLGFNYGANAQFALINQKLDALAAGLDQLSQQLADSTFQSAASSLNPAISNLQTLQNEADQAARANPITNQPQAVPPDTATYLSTIAGFTAQTALAQIQNLCLGLNGNTNLVILGAAVSLQDYNFSPTAQPFTNLLGMPVRTNALLGKALTTYQTYAGYQTMAVNYLGENVHIPANSLDMVVLTRTAQDITNQAAASLALQRQQLPRYLPSDQILVDLQFGIMWYLPIQDKMDWYSARSFASSFSLAGADGVTYGAWHLPTAEEFRTLQQRGRLVKKAAQDKSVAKNSDGGEGDYGRVGQGISSLGFQNAKLLDSDGSVWMTRYYYNVDNFPNSQEQTVDHFRLNHESSNVKGAKTSDKYPVILCRSIVNSNSALSGTSVIPVVYPVYNEVGPDLYAAQAIQSGEVAALGQLVGLGDVSQADGAQTATVGLNYQVTVGGKFRAGTNSVGQDENIPSQTFTFALDTNQAHTVEPQSQNTTLAQVLAYSLTPTQNLFVPFFGVSNLDGSPGVLRYHTDPGGSLDSITLQVQSYGVTGDALVSLSASGIVDAAPTQRQLSSLLIAPRNVLFPSDQSGQIQSFIAVGFYDDQTVEDLTQQVEWTLVDPSGNPVPTTSAELSTNPLGTLKLLSGDTPNFTINASVPGGPSDSTAIRVTTF